MNIFPSNQNNQKFKSEIKPYIGLIKSTATKPKLHGSIAYCTIRSVDGHLRTQCSFRKNNI